MPAMSRPRLLLVLAGCLLVLVGACISVVVEMVIESAVRASVAMDTNDEFDEAMRGIQSPYYTHIWNITNLAQVLEGEKPALSQVTYRMRYTEENYAPRWRDGRREVEYRSWWAYEPFDDETASRLDAERIVQVNPVYLGIVAAFGGTEPDADYGISYLAVTAIAQTVESYLDNLRNSSMSLNLARGGSLSDDPDSPEYVRRVAGADSWYEARGAQFGNSSVTRLNEQNCCVESFPIEFPVVTGLTLSPDEANAFLDTFSNQTRSYSFIASLLASDVGAISLYADAGLSLTTLAQYIDYLFSYAPRDYFVDYVLASGNSGLFTTRSPREVLFGYRDTFFEYYAASYSGILGVQYASKEAQDRVNPPLIYAQKTGKATLKRAGTYTLWRNTTMMANRPDIPLKSGERYSCESLQHYESCRIWLDPVRPTGLTYKRVEPFREGKRKRSYVLWIPELMRPVSVVFEKDETIKGVRGRKYVPADSALLSANCSATTPCNPDNANYRMWGPSYHASMATTQGGVPASVTHPALGKMDNRYRHDLFDGLPEYEESSMGTYVVIEPLTGFFIKGHKRLQYSFDLHATSLTYHSHLFRRASSLYFPYLWFDDTDTIDDADAEHLRRVYSSRLHAKIWTAILVFLGSLCLCGTLVYDRVFPPAPRQDQEDLLEVDTSAVRDTDDKASFVA